MTPREKILRDALGFIVSNTNGHVEDAAIDQRLIDYVHDKAIDATIEFDKWHDAILKTGHPIGDAIKDGPTEDDKKRLRSIISWLDNHTVRESVDKVTVALLWTVWELAKSWGIK